MKVMKGCFGALGCLAALALTAVLLWTLLLVPGGKRRTDAAKELKLGESFRMEANNGLSDAMADVMDLPKTYWIEKDAAVAEQRQKREKPVKKAARGALVQREGKVRNRAVHAGKCHIEP